MQRLGYLLDLTEHRDLADRIAPAVVARAKDVAPLVRAKSRSGGGKRQPRLRGHLTAMGLEQGREGR